jgi:hypothetical protein
MVVTTTVISNRYAVTTVAVVSAFAFNWGHSPNLSAELAGNWVDAPIRGILTTDGRDKVVT